MTNKEFLDLQVRIGHLEKMVDRTAASDPAEAAELRIELENARSAYWRERERLEELYK